MAFIFDHLFHIWVTASDIYSGWPVLICRVLSGEELAWSLNGHRSGKGTISRASLKQKKSTSWTLAVLTQKCFKNGAQPNKFRRWFGFIWPINSLVKSCSISSLSIMYTKLDERSGWTIEFQWCKPYKKRWGCVRHPPFFHCTWKPYIKRGVWVRNYQ